MLSMTVMSPYLRGPVDDPHAAAGLVDDPRTNYLRGLVDDPCVAGGLVDDPHTNYLHGLVDDPRVAGGPVDDPRIHIIATYLQEFPQDQPLSLWAESEAICKFGAQSAQFDTGTTSFLRRVIVVLFCSLSLKSFRRGIG
jgi:hypothetical protein